MDGDVESLCDALAVGGGDVVQGANESAVKGVDRNVVVGAEGLGGESENRVGESGLQVVGVTAGVEEDGEIDGVVALEPHMRWVKVWSGIETDVEFIGGDGWEWLEKGAEDQSGDLNEVGVDVQGVGGIVWGCRLLLWGGLR